MRPVIHIGLPKTGTKTLQWRLFAQHPEVYFLGRFEGGPLREHRAFDACRDATVQAIMRCIAYGDVRNPDFDEVHALLARALAPAAGRVPVWSYEGYATDTLLQRRIRARNARRTFGDATILVALRHPITLLESSYLQWLRATNLGSRRRRYGGPNTNDVHAWLEAEWGRDVDHLLGFADTIRAYEGTFGRDAVQVLLFEDLVADADAFVMDVCRRIGIDPEVGRGCVAGAHDNQRWDVETMSRLHRVAASRFATLRFRFGGAATRRSLLGLTGDMTPQQPSPRYRPRIASGWRERIIAASRAGSEYVAEAYGLPLERYGYFDPDWAGSG